MLDTPEQILYFRAVTNVGEPLETEWFLCSKWLRKDLRDLKMLDTPELILYFRAVTNVGEILKN